jgi:hypothetical protein
LRDLLPHENGKPLPHSKHQSLRSIARNSQGTSRLFVRFGVRFGSNFQVTLQPIKLVGFAALPILLAEPERYPLDQQ